MAILNVTPDSFSDGGRFVVIDDALRQVDKLVEEGADIVDIGGESTRPNSHPVAVDEEINRVAPLIEAVANRFDLPISIDTSKAEVAESAVNAGAEIINDISGLRFDERIADVSARHRTGLILMHLRGKFETMHKLLPTKNIIGEVSESFRWSIVKSESFGVKREQIALDVGIGFSKTFAQNLELISRLNKFSNEFEDFPMMIGISRKSFIGKILNDAPVDERLNGTLAANAIAVWNGANIVRVHNVKETIETLKVVEALKNQL